MLVVHHLNNSRSQRILWALEELKQPYEIKKYMRNSETNLAGDDLKAVHPLGKSPVLTDGDTTVIESSAIINYLIRHYGDGDLRPAPGSPAYDEYEQWLHYAEGSIMTPILLRMYVGRLGEAGAPLHPRIQSELANHFGFVNESLKGKDFFVGNHLTGADIAMSFPAEAAGAMGVRADYPEIERWITAMQERPAYQTALEKGGEYAYA